MYFHPPEGNVRNVTELLCVSFWGGHCSVSTSDMQSEGVASPLGVHTCSGPDVKWGGRDAVCCALCEAAMMMSDHTH